MTMYSMDDLEQCLKEQGLKAKIGFSAGPYVIAAENVEALSSKELLLFTTLKESGQPLENVKVFATGRTFDEAITMAVIGLKEYGQSLSTVKV